MPSFLNRRVKGHRGPRSSSPKVPTDVAAPLLLLSRINLSKADCNRARELCQNISDWELFIDIAERKFSLQLIYKNLSNILTKEEFEFRLSNARDSVLSSKMLSLKIISEQKKFHTLCIEENDIEHVYLKGPSLAARFYDGFTERYSRDIDVLVRSSDLKYVIDKALSEGYRVKTSDRSATSQPDKSVLGALLRYNTVVTLLSPGSAVIEVHTEVDKKLGMIDAEFLFDGRYPLRIFDTVITVPEIEKEFCYLCLHNSRHGWSRLHWLSDLDAILNHPSFDLNRAMTLATAIGLRSAVEGAIEFNALSKVIDGAEIAECGTGKGKDLLRLCLENLNGDLEVELAIRAKHNLSDLPTNWLIDRKRKFSSMIHRTIFRLRPSYYQYEALPLPEYLQWLYYPTKPIFALLRYTKKYQTK